MTFICIRKPKSSCDLLYCDSQFVTVLWNEAGYACTEKCNAYNKNCCLFYIYIYLCISVYIYIYIYISVVSLSWEGKKILRYC